MKFTLFALFVLAACSAAPTTRLVPSDARPGRVNLHYGHREIARDWKPVDEQDLLGISGVYEIEPGGLGIELGFFASEEEKREEDTRIENSSLEVTAGVRRSFGSPPVRPFFGVGLSYLDMEHALNSESVSLEDDDSNLGLYVAAGFDVWITERFGMGLEYRHRSGRDFSFLSNNNGYGSDYGQIALTLSFSF